MWSGNAPVCLLWLILFWVFRGEWNSHVTLFTLNYLAERGCHFPSAVKCHAPSMLTDSLSSNVPVSSAASIPLLSSYISLMGCSQPPVSHTCKCLPLCYFPGHSVVALQRPGPADSLGKAIDVSILAGITLKSSFSQCIFSSWFKWLDAFFKGTLPGPLEASILLPDLCVTGSTFIVFLSLDISGVHFLVQWLYF